MEVGKKETRVCVTGAGGFIASWLVKLLLSQGYNVHGTVRDPSDAKNEHLKKLDKASQNLQLFKVGLLDYDSVLAAIEGCEGVFHVASPVPATKVPNPEVEVISPAVTGTLNVLKACSAVKVKRIIVVSSVGTALCNPHWPQDRVVDEDCWSDSNYLRTKEDWYCLSKTLAESEALKYGKKCELDVVTVCPSWVLGPLLQPTINLSSLALLKILKGQLDPLEEKAYTIVDVRDLADALLLLYEKPGASGRYICTSHSINCHNFLDMLKSMYPNCKWPTKFAKVHFSRHLTSEKLQKLGWKYKPLEESLADAVAYFKEAGLLED